MVRRIALVAWVLSVAGVCAGACGSNSETDTPASATPVGEAGASLDGPPEPSDSAPSLAPSLTAPAKVTIDEETEAHIAIDARNLRRVDVSGLPPGARFDAAKNEIVFRPDFTQHGSYDVVVQGYAGGPPASFAKTVTVTIEVRDNVAPPAPVVISTFDGAGWKRLIVRQTTDAFLDSPGRAGRTFDAVIVVPNAPTAAARAPVRVYLHGFGGTPNYSATSTTSFFIEPHDPDDTYWWGYGEGLPGAVGASVPAYTERRVLHLLAWLLETYPAADPDRAFVIGGSMGGAGALTLGLLHGRHFAGIEATIAPAIPRNHRPSRISQLSGLWGSPAANVGGVWDVMDLTRTLRDDQEARDQFVFTKHGKDDPTIHFGAVVTPSPLTKTSLYATFEREHIGHLAVWDEGAHGPVDPVLGGGWWDAGWSRITDPKAFLARSLPFPAFSKSNANEDPGDGNGNGKKPFNAESGYAADVAVGGDTGWAGAIAGAFNRFLRWDATGFVDTRDRLQMPLMLASGTGSSPPQDGYPTKGDLRSTGGPITVDVTPRRTRHFRPLAGETIRYRYGARTGTAVAAADGSVTVVGLEVTPTPTALELDRDPP